MSLERDLALTVALAIKSATEPLLVRIAVLEAQVAIPGPQGPSGETGRDGLNGKDGVAGINGKDGRDGVDGKDGAVGLTGKDGAQGLAGKDGLPGLNGKDGAQGVSGAPGPSGKDADESLVKDMRERVASLEAVVAAPSTDLTPEDVVASVDAILRKELAMLATPRQRTTKQVIRDEHGRVSHVVEETAS